MAKLVLSLNGTVLNQFFIDKECVSIGRDEGNDVVVNDPLLSREHARIVSVGEDHIVEDLHSSNGTLINGNRLERHILQHRDVIHLGSHHLCYVNTRMASEVDLERTMLIQAMPRHREPAEDAPVVAVPAMRAAKARLPEGCIKVLAGVGSHVAGETVNLDRVVTTFGIPGEQLVVIARRPQGYFLTHVEGVKPPRINRAAIGGATRALQNGDQIEAAGCRLEFQLKAFADNS